MVTFPNCVFDPWITTLPWLPVETTVTPTVEPLTLDEAKAQCRAQGISTDDDLLTSYIVAARHHVEQYCGIRLLTQTVVMRCGTFDQFGLLPAAPLQSLSGITYLDVNGVSQTLDPTIYEAMLFGLSPSIRLQPTKTYPSVLVAGDAITVTAIAGFGDAATAIPAPIILAMKMLIGQWYDNRQDFQQERGTFALLPNAVAALLANYRR